MPTWDGVAVACAVRAPWEVRAVSRHKAFPAAMRLRKREREHGGDRGGAAAADRERDAAAARVVGPSQEDEGVRVEIDEFARTVLQVTLGHGRARNPAVPPGSRSSART